MPIRRSASRSTAPPASSPRAGAMGHRGPSRHRRHRRRRPAEGQGRRRAAHRPARRHGRAAMEENTNLPWRSTIPNRFHGCGHDGHTTILLGAARYLAETRNFSGTVAFIFQPAEEGLGGARAMLRDGLFERFPVDEVYGLHNAPDLAPRQVSIFPGPSMAAADFFDITIAGYGSHGAMPERSRDPVVIAMTLGQALQTIVSRNVDPLQSAVLSITQIHAGSAYNVIPGEAKLAGTVRPSRTRSVSRFASACAPSPPHGGGVRCRDRRRYPRRVLGAVQSRGACRRRRPRWRAASSRGERADSAAAEDGSEDFADMLLAAPGAYFWLGPKVRCRCTIRASSSTTRFCRSRQPVRADRRDAPAAGVSRGQRSARNVRNGIMPRMTATARTAAAHRSWPSCRGSGRRSTIPTRRRARCRSRSSVDGADALAAEDLQGRWR